MTDRIAIRYDRAPGTGMYATVIATLADGRQVMIDTQYSAVLPQGGHIPRIPDPNNRYASIGGCPQLTQHGGRCTCAANADIMAIAELLVAEARAVGLPEVEAQAREARAATQQEREPASPEWLSSRGLTLTEEMDREDSDY